MKDSTKDAFIITIEPLPNDISSQSTENCSLLIHGREAMDQHSAGDTESTNSSKSIIPTEDPKQQTWKIRTQLWMRTQAVKIRTSRTRQALIAFGLVVTATLLGVFIWLGESGRIHEAFKKTVPLQLNQGSYLGEVVSQSSKYPRSIQAFRGIPYAQSTAGENRFRPPQPLNGTIDRDNVQRAISYGHICPQGSNSNNQGEDCLNANIFRPHFSDDPNTANAEMAKLGKLPVVVYVHGGGFNSGNGAERNMLSFAAWSEMPLIGMSFNYRVGALGFLPSGLTEKEGLLNLGLKDQQAFFKWMQDNVADIGGDPNNVTIMGLSAGAHSVGHHLISYSPANKLTSAPVPFQKAILESGGSTARATFNPTHPLHEKQFQEFLKECGVSNTTDDEIFESLRSLPLNTVRSASSTVYRRWNPSLRWAFQPVIDGPGGIIPDLPIKSWEKGNFLRIPILTGYNTNEGTVFVPSKANNASAMNDLMTGILPSLNKTDIETMDTLYPDPASTMGKRIYVEKPPAGFGTQFWRLDDSYAHYAYICPVLLTAHLASTASDAGPVYTYHYAARSNAHGAADHGDEAPIVAHDMDVIGSFPGVVATADAMNGFWSRFAATGNPNPSNATAASTSNATAFSWPKFISPFINSTEAALDEANSTKVVALFGQGNDERMGVRGRQNKGIAAQYGNLTERVREECEFWWGRVILSEGFGNGSTSIGTKKTTQSKL
ncbi:hypothetical protein M426DRAFT_320891 [Hypoxylon sp. CI-4A]|nr:hypothetical protein M426DRAFT_320891 [Hypoxylon sp. CI-4A]